MLANHTHRGRAPSRRKFRTYASDQTGATAVEYGILLALIAVFLLTAVTAVGTNLRGVMNQISNAL